MTGSKDLTRRDAIKAGAAATVATAVAVAGAVIPAMASTGDAALIAAWREFQEFHDALVSPSPYLTDGDFNELGEAKLSAIETVLAEYPVASIKDVGPVWDL